MTDDTRTDDTMTHDANGDRTVAVVTGAAQGIGRAIAARLLAQGYAVAGLDVDEQVTASMSSLHGRALGLTVDITDEAAVRDAFDRVAAELGPPRVLVNNAALTAHISSILKMDLERWRRELDVNLTGAFVCTRAALPAMREAGWGRIINISSLAASGGLDRQSAYAASKAGMLGLTRNVTIEHAAEGVTCNAILPGLILSEKAAQMPEALKQAVLEQIPAGRFGRPEEVAALTAFLASDEAGFINGAEIRIDGGSSCTQISLARRPKR